MTDIKCPYDDTIKNYIIPTKSWLKALNQLDTFQDVSINKKIILSQMIEKENVIVKVTNGKNPKLRDINMMIKGLPNMVYTFCVIFCNDYLSLILQNKFFCSSKDSKYKVTLEIMKYYNGGSLSVLNQISFRKFKLILDQLVLAQINLFNKTGITHCDIHPGNILINKHPLEKELNYSYIHGHNIIKSKYEFILSDYDKCIIFSPNYMVHDEILDGNLIRENITETLDDLSQSTLYVNILRTINMLIDKLDNINKQKIRLLHNDLLIKNEEIMIKKERKYLTKYIKELNNHNKINSFNKYKTKVCLINFEYFNQFCKIIT
jgi:hypothetical protein